MSTQKKQELDFNISGKKDPKWTLKQDVTEEDVVRAINSGELTREELCDKMRDDNMFAIDFARWYPQYKDFVKNNFIHTNAGAYNWVYTFGEDRNEFRSRISDPEYALYWAINIGDVGHMKAVLAAKKYRRSAKKYVKRWNDTFDKDYHKISI